MANSFWLGSEGRRYTLTERTGVAWAQGLGEAWSRWWSSGLVIFV